MEKNVNERLNLENLIVGSIKRMECVNIVIKREVKLKGVEVSENNLKNKIKNKLKI
jgi:hypothetical protein